MRQFDLKEYLDNPNQKIRTRDGRKVRIICTDVDAERCIIALASSKAGEMAYEYYNDGTRWTDFPSEHDLFFATKKKKCPFKEGDRILVRDSHSNWTFNKFSSYKEGAPYPYVCFSAAYKQCIPLNENTWKLLGTSDEHKEEEQYETI